MLDFLIPTEQRATLEDPNVPISAENAYAYVTGDRPVASGVKVNGTTVAGIPAIRRGITLLSSGVANLPLKVFRRTDDGREPAEDHPAYYLVHQEPNRWMTAYTFWETLVAAAIMGNGYAEIIRTKDELPDTLILLDPGATWPVTKGGMLAYKTMTDGGKERTIAADDMLHIKGWGDGIVGYSVISQMRQALGLPIAKQEHESSFYANSCASNLAISIPGKFKDDDAAKQYRRQLMDKQAGTNTFSPLLMTGGATATAMSINHEDAQFLEGQNFDIRQLANILGLPPHKLGDDSRSSYNSLEQENKAYLQDSLQPWLRKVETECDRKLLRLGNYRSRRFYFEFERKALLQADQKAETESLVMQVNNGGITLNEWRKIQNLPAYTMPEADQPRIPVNLSHVGAEPPAPDPPPEPAEPPAEPDDAEPEENSDVPRAAILAAHRRLLAAELARMSKRIAKQAERAAKRPDRWVPWVEKCEADNRQVFVEALQPTVDALSLLHGFAVDDVLRELAGEFFQRYKSELLAAAECQPEQLPARVRETCERNNGQAALMLADEILN